jgi:hypothetical protein
VIPAILVIKVDEDVTVQTVRSEQDQYDEVRNEKRDVKPIGMVETLKGAIKEMLADVRTNSLGRNHRSNRRQIRNEQTSQPDTPARTGVRAIPKPFILPEAAMKAGGYDVFRADQGWSAGAGMIFNSTF